MEGSSLQAQVTQKVPELVVLEGMSQGKLKVKKKVPEVEESTRELYRGRGSFLEWRRVRRSKKSRIRRKWGERLLGKNFCVVQENATCIVCQNTHEDSTKGEVMKRQERMKVVKDMTKKIRSKGWIDAENRWWVAELLADCEKAWLHPEEEETIQKWYVWCEEMKKKYEKRKTAKGESDDQECGQQCWSSA